MTASVMVLSGPRGSGKTTTCLQVAEAAKARGLDVAGVICPARFSGGRKIGFDLLDVRRGERRPLAEADSTPGVLRTQRYRFLPETMAWGGELIAAAPPCDLLIIDELGPLELVQGRGWTVGLAILARGGYNLALVVVRPELVRLFHQWVPDRTGELLTLPSRPGVDPVITILRHLD